MLIISHASLFFFAPDTPCFHYAILIAAFDGHCRQILLRYYAALLRHASPDYYAFAAAADVTPLPAAMPFR